MSIRGAIGMTFEELDQAVSAGARILVFPYTVSVVFVTLKRVSGPILVLPGTSTFRVAWPYVAVSLLLGWWGFPYGFIYTPQSLYECLRGGGDVTSSVMTELWDEHHGLSGHALPQAGWHPGELRSPT